MPDLERKERTDEWLRHNRDAAIAMLRRLVAIPSENTYPRGNELAVQLEIEAYMKELGLATDRFLVTDVPGIETHEAFLQDGRDYTNRPNVVGVWHGTGGGKSLLFSGHVDTVPLGAERWMHEPFAGEIADGHMYGLGIFDMKAGIAAALLAVRCLRDSGFLPAGDVIVETVVDEEFGGSNGTLACILRGYEADAAIVPEPSNMSICPVNEGGVYYRLAFAGRPGRSYSAEALANPVYAAARFLEIVRKYDAWRNANREAHPLFPQGELRTDVQIMRAGNVAYELGDRVPSTCEIDLWIQLPPGKSEEHIRSEFVSFCEPLMRADDTLADTALRLERKMRFLPGTGIATDHPIVAAIRETAQQEAGLDLPVQGARFACDIFMFNLYSRTPAVVFGPKGGNAHAPDEYIDIDAFIDLIRIYAGLIVRWCGTVETLSVAGATKEIRGETQ